MPSVEERVAYLEGRVEDQGRSVLSLGEGMTRLEARMDGLDLKIDRYREELAGRIDALSQSVNARFEAMDRKIDRVSEDLSRKLSRHFVWLVGIQISVLLAVIGALLAG